MKSLPALPETNSSCSCWQAQNDCNCSLTCGVASRQVAKPCLCKHRCADLQLVPAVEGTREQMTSAGSVGRGHAVKCILPGCERSPVQSVPLRCCACHPRSLSHLRQRSL